MGAVYKIDFHANIKKEKIGKLVETAKEYMRTIDCLKGKLSSGVSPDNRFYLGAELENILYQLFAGFQKQYVFQKTNNEVKVESFFNASYSWERVMFELFEKIAPFLEDDSRLLVYPDNGFSDCVVKCGKAEYGIWRVNA